ncbi:MAG TPA: hypothetical protein VFT79_06805 [Solirubrobacterales bacterium]|nr:hypothetical protein [Solirubrobacterales bacterium]
MSDRGSTVYVEYVKDQVAQQDERKESIEKRGLAVITSSGTIVSLLFGLVAVLTGVEKYELPAGAEPWLGCALAGFITATLAGIVTNVPLHYQAVEPDELKKAVKSHWSDAPEVAEQRVAATEIKVLASAQRKNSIKGWVLVVAVSAQLFAVASLALAVRVILVHA